MVYRFHITSTEKPDFQLEVEAGGQHSFAEFHSCIQQACGFQTDQLASFFTGSSTLGRQVEITQLNMGYRMSDKLIMDRTPLQQILGSEQHSLLYVYDFFMDRLLNIELTQIFMGKSVVETSVTLKKGNAPNQLLEDEVLAQEVESKQTEKCSDYGDLDDYTEIFGEMEDLLGGI